MAARELEDVLKEVIRVRKHQRQLEEQKAREAQQMRDDIIQLALIFATAIGIMVGLFVLAVVMS